MFPGVIFATNAVPRPCAGLERSRKLLQECAATLLIVQSSAEQMWGSLCLRAWEGPWVCEIGCCKCSLLVGDASQPAWWSVWERSETVLRCETCLLCPFPALKWWLWKVPTSRMGSFSTFNFTPAHLHGSDCFATLIVAAVRWLSTSQLFLCGQSIPKHFLFRFLLCAAMWDSLERVCTGWR